MQGGQAIGNQNYGEIQPFFPNLSRFTCKLKLKYITVSNYYLFENSVNQTSLFTFQTALIVSSLNKELEKFC